jgi:hypothetical protein
MCYNGKEIHPLPFNSENYDCSDACPIDDNNMILSSTLNGNYDLCYYDGVNVSEISELNTDINELGADFYSYAEYLENNSIKGDINNDGEFNIADAVIFQKWLLDVSDTELKNPQRADINEDDILDIFDLCQMRKNI